MKIPVSEPSNKQLSRRDANESRFVTKARFDVERVNGLIENVYNLFSLVAETYAIPHLMTDYRIAAALVNKYGKVKRDKQTDDEIATKMLNRLHVKNNLANFVNKKVIQNAIKTKKITAFIQTDEFPQLEQEDLFSISCGIYQIEQAKSYAFEHMKANNDAFVAQKIPEEMVRSEFPGYFEINLVKLV